MRPLSINNLLDTLSLFQVFRWSSCALVIQWI